MAQLGSVEIRGKRFQKMVEAEMNEAKADNIVETKGRRPRDVALNPDS